MECDQSDDVHKGAIDRVQECPSMTPTALGRLMDVDQQMQAVSFAYFPSIAHC
jgi:hypothetical protein